jgi:hypothetical protein
MTSTKYYLLSVLGALMVAVGVLIVAPSAEAQTALDPTVDKECTPNPVQVGEQITCTIDVLPAPNTLLFVRVEDTLPDGLTVIGATSEIQLGGESIDSIPCTVEGNTVTCPPAPQTRVITNTPFFSTIFRVTIEASAEQCGTFQNTATAVVPNLQSTLEPVVLLDQRFQDTEQITVEGCEEAGGVGGGTGGGAAPITQEGEQESESGEIDQSFDVS